MISKLKSEDQGVPKDAIGELSTMETDLQMQLKEMTAKVKIRLTSKIAESRYTVRPKSAVNYDVNVTWQNYPIQ